MRSIGVSYSKLVDDSYLSYTLFDDIEEIEKQEQLDKSIDEIRNKFGYTSIINGSSLMEGSRVIERSKLVGGHAGGLDGVL